MLRYKIDVKDALERVGFGVYDAKKSGYIAQNTLYKLMAEDTAVSLEAINRLCVILDMDIRDVIAWEMSAEDAADRERITTKKRRRVRTAAGDPLHPQGTDGGR